MLTILNPKPKTGKSAGFDYGNKTFLTSDEGNKIVSPQFFKQSLKTLQSLNKAVSRKVKGSGNWYRACRALARQPQKSCQAESRLAMETCHWTLLKVWYALPLKRWTLTVWNGFGGRKVSDHAFYQFLQILEQKCAKHDKTFVKNWTMDSNDKTLFWLWLLQTKIFLFLIDSGLVPDVVRTTIET